MVTDEKRQVMDLFRQGRNLYKQMQFAEAFKRFAEALKIDPEDQPSKVYLARCKHYAKNPPPPDWDGVWVYTTK
jgi:Flp pilus assembly protein TadD